MNPGEDGSRVVEVRQALIEFNQDVCEGMADDEGPETPHEHIHRPPGHPQEHGVDQAIRPLIHVVRGERHRCKEDRESARVQQFFQSGEQIAPRRKCSGS
jgi:hypothetical protein